LTCDADEIPPGDAFLDSAINASRALTGIAVRSMNLSLPEASPPVWRALWALTARGAQRPSDLASALNVSAATGTRICAKLAADGLADRSEDPDDGRNVLVTINQKGQSTLDTAVARQRAFFARALAKLSPGQRQELAAAFEALYAAARDTDVMWP
jgi:DNA-binding MarR family transcriptional regulator